MNWIRRVMIGRYGIDQLGVGLIGFSLVLMLLRGVTHGFFSGLLSLLALVSLALCYLRLFSRNFDRRRRENELFMTWWRPISQWLSGRKAAFQEFQTYKHFKCPHCGQKIRIPRGRGKVSVSCPGCRKQFIKKT